MEPSILEAVATSTSWRHDPPLWKGEKGPDDCLPCPTSEASDIFKDEGNGILGGEAESLKSMMFRFLDEMASRLDGMEARLAQMENTEAEDSNNEAKDDIGESPPPKPRPDSKRVYNPTGDVTPSKDCVDCDVSKQQRGEWHVCRRTSKIMGRRCRRLRGQQRKSALKERDVD
jgi:hypothetical protein